MHISQNKKILVCDLSKKKQNQLYSFVQMTLADFLYEYLPVNYPFSQLNSGRNLLINYDLIYKNLLTMDKINSFNILAISTDDLEDANFIKTLLDHKVNFNQSFLIFYDFVNNHQHHKKIINFLKMVKNQNYIVIENINDNLTANSLLYWKLVSLL